MPSELLSVTTQAALFSMLSTTLAQGITVYQHNSLSLIEILPFIKFMIIAIITTPPNYLYQRFLEQIFPSKVSKSIESDKKQDDKPIQSSERLSISNTIAKFILEQSLGAAVNTVVFIFLAGLLKGNGFDHILQDIQKDFFPMLLAGWKVWPLVTLLNLVVVPFDQRMLVGNTVGVMWGVYMNLKMA